MAKTLALWLGALLLAGLTACGATRIATNLPTGEGGYIVVSLGAARLAPDQTYYLNFRQLATKSELQVGVHFHGLPFVRQAVDFEVDRGEAGNVITRRVPPGEYEVTQFITSSNLGYKNVISGPKNELGIRFKVDREKATYLGRYLVHTTSAVDASGQLRPVNYVVVADEEARDVAIAKQKRELPLDIDVSRQIVDSSQLKHPLVRGR